MNPTPAGAPASAATACAPAGKYMLFQLAGQPYGIAILDVREIIGLMEITPVPRAPAFVRGVINLRGRVIPVVDLRLQFGMPACPAGDQAVIIVVQCTIGGRQVTRGVLVDQVLEVLPLGAEQIEPPPDLGGSREHAFVLGVGKSARHVVLLVDISRLLERAE